MNVTIDHLVKSVPILEPGDTIRRAAGLIRTTEGSRVLVHDSGQIVGTVSEQAIAGFLARNDDVESALDQPVEPIVDRSVVLVSAGATLRQAADVFASSGSDVLPVIGSLGAYQGAIYRRDLIGLLTRNLRPPTVAGMATPLGVYLTTGSVSGGAGSLGLFLTGVSLATMLVLSNLAVMGLMRLVEKLTHINLTALLASAPLTARFSLYDLPFYLSTVLTIAVFFLLMRLSPLSGYHAAEHMTVHAMEAGEALTPEHVKRMPRVHPRCGTNLLTAAGVFIIITTRVSNQFTVLIALVAVVLGWRSIGGMLQYLVTTKNPSPRQLANGVAAGNQLVDRYLERPGYTATGFARVWKMGFLQTAAGMGLTLWIVQVVLKIPMM